MADHIVINDIAPRVQYTGDGAQTAFTYPFPIFDDADLAVYVDGELKVASADYTVSGAGADAGGSATFAAAPPDGAIVTLLRDLAVEHDAVHLRIAYVYAQIHEGFLD